MMEDLRQLITTFHFTHSESSYHDSVNMMKLWKGLFYCYWMTDKPVVQEYVAKEMANFTLLFNDNSLSLLYLQCFWRILMREWVGIDYLR
jgi:ribosomal RNA-processing protein 1